MKTIVSIFFVLFAVAIVHSMPQGPIVAEVAEAAEAEATPNRPVLNAIAGIANAGMNIAKSGAENLGRFIEGSADTVSTGITNLAQFTAAGINRPFLNTQPAGAAAAAVASE